MPQGAAWEKWGAFTNLGAEDLLLPPSQTFQGSQDPRPCLLLPPPGRGAEAGPAVPFLPALGGDPCPAWHAGVREPRSAPNYFWPKLLLNPQTPEPCQVRGQNGGYSHHSRAGAAG